eukprot:scaffold82467_cov54-Attheya_sp.AAC.2
MNLINFALRVFISVAICCRCGGTKLCDYENRGWPLDEDEACEFMARELDMSASMSVSPQASVKKAYSKEQKSSKSVSKLDSLSAKHGKSINHVKHVKRSSSEDTMRKEGKMDKHSKNKETPKSGKDMIPDNSKTQNKSGKYARSTNYASKFSKSSDNVIGSIDHKSGKS